MSQDEQHLAAKYNLALSLLFYIVALFIIVAIPSYFRCTPKANQIGQQKINSVSDCDNLLLTTCTNSCGKTYNEANEAAARGTSALSSTPVGNLLRIPEGSCVVRGDTFFVMAVSTGSSFSSTTFHYAITSQEECKEKCNLVVVGDMWDFSFGYVGEPVTSVNCSCSKVAECSCDYGSFFTYPAYTVTDTRTCQMSFTQEDQHRLFPLDMCEGMLDEVVVCESAVSTIGVIGGYLSILFSVLKVAFSFALSWEQMKLLKAGSHPLDSDLELVEVGEVM